MNKKQILNKARKYVYQRFSESEHANMFYHNLEHTLYVVKNALGIAANYPLSKDDLIVLELAALFHDIGVTEQMEKHEELGSAIMRNFLEKEQLEEELIVKISFLIMATKLPQRPSGLLEEIICDADLYHLGKKSFLKKSENLKRERESLQEKVISDEDWLNSTLAFMEQHCYRTVYCISTLDKGKKANISLVKEKLMLAGDKIAGIVLKEPEPIQGNHKERDRDKPEKGIETMFRITSSNNQRMSDMADNKAHILITVNSIIISAIVSLALRKLEDNTYLAYPTFMLLAVSLVAMTFSILATRPSIPKGTYTESEFDLKQVNLLFFGNFYKMPLGDYTRGMMKIMDDKDFLYQTLIRDVYGQGTVLGKKYQLLRIAYDVFMYGLIMAVLAFILVTALRHEQVSPLVGHVSINPKISYE